MLLVKGRILGKGSYATVFRAVSAAPQRGCSVIFAVKTTSILSSAVSLLKEKNILEFFRNCPEIVQCFGSQITIEQGVYVHNLFLECAPYGTLANLIKKERFLESQVKAYTRMLLQGLSCIHSKGFVHCDLKPENVLVFPPSSQHHDGTETASNYQLKIADFGLSKTIEEKLNFNAGNWRFRFRGTPFYMSPESIAIGEIEPSLDIWSLGCIVIEMITGLPPWSHLKLTSAGDLMWLLVVEKQAPYIPNESLSQDCTNFLSKCFITDSSMRWTADLLLDHPFLSSPTPHESPFKTWSIF